MDKGASEILASVEELARRGGITQERAFSAWYAINMFDVDEDAALEAANLDGGEDNGIDFLYVDKTNERIIILQAHFPKETVKAAPKGKFDTLVAAIPSLENPDAFRKAGRMDIAAAVEEAKENLQAYDVIIGTVSFGKRSDQIYRAVATTNECERFKPFRFFYYSHDDILAAYGTLNDDRVGEDSITFEGNYFEDKGEYGRAVIGSISATELGRLYTMHQEGLFARNVRLFLGTRKGSINEQIVSTAKKTPGKFWALNNGITIVAETIANTDDIKTFKLKRFSIVNGCQTTVSLARADSPAGAKVLARVVAANQSVSNDIVRFNNTQNVVRIWTVRAADPVHEKLRISFKSIDVEYAPKPDNRRNSKSGKETIALDRLAQYLAAAGQNLIEAVREKSELFDHHYQIIFPHDLIAEETYLIWKLGVSSDESRQTRLDAFRKTEESKELIQLLGVPGTYWIVHVASRFINAINPKPWRLTLTVMRDKAFNNALQKYVEMALDIYIELATDAYSAEEYTSVRQALRSPKFLQKIDQKLMNRCVKLKKDRAGLPILEHVYKGIKK